jgi:hypothetical protein
MLGASQSPYSTISKSGYGAAAQPPSYRIVSYQPSIYMAFSRGLGVKKKEYAAREHGAAVS